MKSLLFFLTLLSLSLATPPRFLQFLKVLSPQCSYHGNFYNSQCHCNSGWQGARCELARTIGYSDDSSTTCDDLLARLDHLTNISPENYPGDDYEFSRFDSKTIGTGDGKNTWIKMHTITSSWQIFGRNIQATDIRQGGLANCYLLATFASMAVHKNGQYIKDIFLTQKDNQKHVYVTRWMVAGKPRFVAVDDYVPGSGKKPSFSKAAADNDYWSMILEKSWAKIHGNYKITEFGHLTNVWKSLTQAPVFSKKIHKRTDTPASIFAIINDKFSKSFPIGATTPRKSEIEVASHAYAIIGSYDLTLKSGVKLQLIKMYNPWNSEVWKTNPWADSSSKWTPEIRSLVGYVNANDGVFYLTPQDFFKIYEVITWAEMNPDYEISFIDVPIDADARNQSKEYTTRFRISGNTANQPVFVYIDQPDGRLFPNCGAPYHLNSIKAINSRHATIYPSNESKNVITLRSDGSYHFNANIFNKASYSKYLTVTAYHPKGVLTFTSRFQKVVEKDCAALKNCNGNGKCNYYSGTCQCFKGFRGNDCGRVAIACPGNCLGNGVCNPNTGICSCKPGFNGLNCSPKLRMSYLKKRKI